MNKKFLKFLSEKGHGSEEIFDKLSAKEKTALFNEYNEKAREEIDEAIKAKVDKEDIEKLKSELKESRDLQFNELREAVKVQGIVLEKILTVEVDPKGKTFNEQLRDSLKANATELGKLSKSSSGSVRFQIASKAATDPLLQTTGTTISGGNIPQPFRKPDWVDQRRIMPFVRQLITNVPLTESDIVEWVEVQNIEETTGGTTENTLKNNMSWQYVIRSERAKTRTVTTKVSTRMLNRIDMMMNKINNQLIRSLNIDMDDQILRGDGTGENLTGIIPNATAFDAGASAATIPAPNNFDVVRVGIKQMRMEASGTVNGSPEPAGFEATVLVVSPEAGAAMDLSKGSDGHYVMPPFISQDGTVIKGVPVVESNFMGDNEFLLMDGTLAEFYLYENMIIDVGFVDKDFTMNLRTVLAEQAALLVIAENNRGAFIVGDFATAKADLLAA